MFILHNDSSFWPLWKELSVQQFLTPFYSPYQSNYVSQRPKDDGFSIRDLSFIQISEDKPIAAFRGAILEDNLEKKLLYFEHPCVAIVDRKLLTHKSEKAFLHKVDDILDQCEASLWFRDFVFDGQLSTLSRHLLLKGAKTMPVFSQIIDLSDEESEIYRKIRNNNKPHINWGLNEIKPKVFDASNLTWEQMQAFRQLHIREAGCETRSEKSWFRQFEMVQAAEAFIVLGDLGGELISAGFFSFNKNNCYYWVSASRRELFEKPLSHSLIWTAILHAKKLGCRWFEVGELFFPKHPSDKPPSKKELGISIFKSGFGGETRMFLDLKLDFSEKKSS